MPKQRFEDDEMPRRRRRGAQAVAIEAEERGLAMRLLLHSPKDMVAAALAVAAVIGILTNALFLQAGRHPSPMFGSSVVTLPAPVAAVALPRPRPVEAAVRAAEPIAAEARPVEARSVEVKPVEKSVDPMTNLVVKSTGSAPAAAHAANPAPKPSTAAAVAPSSVMRPPASIPVSGPSTASKRIAAVQRALTEYGYGQLKPTGTIGSDTQAAIQKFERDRKLPVTGQMSDRVVKELAAMIGHPVE